MRILLAVTLLLGLGACGGPKTETFVCINGPDLAVTYDDESATVTFANGRTELLPRDPSRDGVYAKPGVAWHDTAFRSGRLTDGSSSYSCDQSSI